MYLSHLICSEQIARASRGHAPSIDFLGIRPQQLAHGSVTWNLQPPVDGVDLHMIAIGKGRTSSSVLTIGERPP